ncbi:hypothetical protein ACOMHN_033972 [Nucella lapillus]
MTASYTCCGTSIYLVLVMLLFRFRSDDRQLHMLWHQCLLTFAQRYKGDLCQEQKQELFAIIRKHFHPEISPEIRRELESQASTRK